MAGIILITGGSRSGKSDFARDIAEAMPARRVFLATSPVTDEEMRARIERHRAERDGSKWSTIEERIDLAGVLRGCTDFDLVLVDCLTLWVNNLMFAAQQAGLEITEDDVTGRCEELLSVCASRPGTVIFVSNETGMGIVPDNETSRRFRDLLGRCNRMVARAANQVTLVVCGLPLNLKA